MFRAAFSIVRVVLGQQNNVFTPNFEIILKISVLNVSKKCNEISQFLSSLMDIIVQMSTIVQKIYMFEN